MANISTQMTAIVRVFSSALDLNSLSCTKKIAHLHKISCCCCYSYYYSMCFFASLPSARSSQWKLCSVWFIPLCVVYELCVTLHGSASPRKKTHKNTSYTFFSLSFFFCLLYCTLKITYKRLCVRVHIRALAALMYTHIESINFIHLFI